MGIDKMKAKKGQWRIKELTFVILGLMGGTSGIILAMIFFHHKQSKIKFYYGMPLLYIVNTITKLGIFHYLLK